ncbi:MAG: hypothetical protein FD123_2470 [Bacteroidetes bacterium]|nr:MAG: hypothetical protein FD123_2470 [Bacteroidota bacterium]
MKKQLHVLLLALLPVLSINAQPVYNASDYAVAGDTVFLTQAQTGSYNFDTTGVNMTWNYAALTGVSQRRLRFRLPTQTGFTFTQWPYIYNSSNVNLSSTDDQAVSLGNFQQTDPNDYFLKNNSLLEQKASSFAVGVNNTSINVKNVYTTSDVLYRFPMNYGDLDSSLASYTSSIPGFYYRETSIKRVNENEGWGTVITPYGSFSNCLKMVSSLMQIDTISIDTFGVPTDTLYFREFRWMSPGWNYPVLTVRQIKTGMIYITQSIEYYDVQQYFQPNALFAYLPVGPLVGDTVLFQNLSTNSTGYRWNFGDPASGAGDSSAAINPSHVFNAAGTYYVQLIAENGTLSDTITLPVNVSVMTSAGEESSASLLHIYPNPAGEKICLQGINAGEGEILLYDCTGKVAGKFPLAPELNIADLKPGVYFVVIRKENEVIIRKMIKT